MRLEDAKILILLSFLLAISSQDANSTQRWESKNFHKPSREELRRVLTPAEFEITQNDDTEPPFKNAYWNNHEPGIYVDRVSGEPLFSSLEKYDSGTGWPSFWKPLVSENVIEVEDSSPERLMWVDLSQTPVTELRSKYADSHLGHVFDDGPPPTGRRYCIDSASIRFVPVSQLKESGYEEFLSYFRKADQRPQVSHPAWCFVPQVCSRVVERD